jgi:hypothetical protein
VNGYAESVAETIAFEHGELTLLALAGSRAAFDALMALAVQTGYTDGFATAVTQ